MKTSWEFVGEIGVDAGLVWIGDPCYCVTPDCSSHPAKTWTEFCDELKEREKRGVAVWDSGISLCTAYGDGAYKVFVKRDKEGRLVRALVRLA